MFAITLLFNIQYISDVVYLNTVESKGLSFIYTQSWMIDKAIKDLLAEKYFNVVFDNLFFLVNMLFLLYVISKFFNRLEKRISKSRAETLNFDRHAAKGVIKMVVLSCYFVITLSICQQIFGLSLASLLAVGGIGGLSIGLAAKDILSNLFGGFLIFIEKPFSIGDWVSSPDREIEGIIEDIGWRMTTVRTFEKRLLHIPNSIFQSIIVENVSKMPFRRIRLSFGLDYKDFENVQAITQDIEAYIKNSEDFVCDFESEGERVAVPCYATMVEFDSSSLKIDCYTFSKDKSLALYLKRKEQLLTKIKSIVERYGSEIPYNTIRIIDENKGKP